MINQNLYLIKFKEPNNEDWDESKLKPPGSSRLFHLLLTIEDDEEFEDLKSQEGNKDSKLYEYANQFMNNDDFLLENRNSEISDPESFYLPNVIDYRVSGLLECEEYLASIISFLRDKWELKEKLSESMGDFAQHLEKFRLDSGASKLDKLFLYGGFIDEDNIKDIDDIAFAK